MNIIPASNFSVEPTDAACGISTVSSEIVRLRLCWEAQPSGCCSRHL